jgi:PAS domain S-box-containing protein
MVGTAVIAFAVIGSSIAVQTLDHARDRARQNATFQADLAARSIDDALTLGMTTLAGMSGSLPTAELIATPAKCQLLFSGLGPFQRAHIDVLLPDGRVICSSLAKSGAPKGATQAGAGWVAQTLKASAPLVSAVFPDRLTGSEAIAIAVPLAGADGRPAAILAVVLSLPPLSAGLAATYGGPEGFSFAVRGNDQTLSEQTSSDQAAAGDAPRLIGSAQATSVPWRISASTSEADALRPTRALLLKGGWLGLGALFLLLIVLFLVNRQIARPLDRLSAAEGKLRVSEERLRLLLRGARDYAIVMLDAEGLVASWSPSAQLLDGYSEEDILGCPYAVFFTGEEAAADRPAQVLRTAAVTGRDEHEGVRVRQDGSRYWARTVLTARRNPAGELQGFVIVAHDATVRHEVELTTRRMNDELEQRVEDRTTELERQARELHAANAELQAFSYSVSHDLRAPLRSINGFASILSTYGGDLPEEAKHYADRIVQNAHTLTEMVDALLSLSATQTLSIDVDLLDLTMLARSAWDELTPELEGREVELVLHTLAPGRGDPRLVRQVLANLLGNALKYSRRRERATIEVGSRTSAEATVYFVRDNGAGFDMRYSSGLFQVFQRLHHAEDYPGTGIGLASVKRIITRHGGQVWAEGKIDHGATFYFTLEPTSEHLKTTEQENVLDVSSVA